MATIWSALLWIFFEARARKRSVVVVVVEFVVEVEAKVGVFMLGYSFSSRF
jgi:hypothetical protein